MKSISFFISILFASRVVIQAFFSQKKSLKKRCLILLCLLFNSIGFTQQPSAPGLPENWTSQSFANHIQHHENYFDSLQNSGFILDSLADYKFYLREKRYWYGLTNPEMVGIQQFQTIDQNWIKSSETDWDCKTNETYPYLDFQEIGPKYHSPSLLSSPNGTGQIHYLEFDKTDPTDNTMLACSQYGGLFKSDDGGDNWVNAGTDYGLPHSSVSSIALSVFLPQTTWYVSTGNAEEYSYFPKPPSFGIWRTTNGGLSYENISESNIELNSAVRIRKIIVILDGGMNRIIAATTNGLFTCADADATVPIWTELCDGEFYDVESKPDNYKKIYACGDRYTQLI